MVTKTKKKSTPRKSAVSPTKEKKVDFNGAGLKTSTSNGHFKNGGLRPSPSTNTLNRLAREKIVLWKQPLTTTYYAFMEVLNLTYEFITGMLHQKTLLLAISIFSALIYYAYITPGPHQDYIAVIEKKCAW
ncbi:unnamed protein product [Cylicostephanus goldi]|uniref:Uncharacterized protein n=1 Tax=Cylicostephanus goldi TaxID=71465 RepID=A0A3P7P275_CYLGO|nr:unnamed protein product [Cylicostephanus goldi]